MISLKYIVAILLLFVSISTVFAQERIDVVTAKKEMSKGTQTAFTVFVPEADSKFVENEWKKFINERPFFEFATKGTSQTVEKVILGISNIFSKEKKEYTKNSLKVEKFGNELLVQDVIHEELTNNHLDIFARITGAETGVYLSSFFQYSDSIFIDRSVVDEDVFQSINNYIRSFGVETYQKVVENQIDNEKKVLRKDENDLEKLQRKNKDLYKSTGHFETDIDECNDNIRRIEYDLKRIEERSSQYKDSLRQFNKKTIEYDALQVEIKENEKVHKKTYRQIKAQKNNIKQNQDKIRKVKIDIIGNENDQKVQQEIINQQEIRVKEFENKLANIK